MKLRTKFQDENFELGEVVEGAIVECLGKHEEKLRVIATAAEGGQHTFCYNSIKDFIDHWEDVPEEPKWLRDYWFIDSCGSILKQKDDVLGSIRREIGNYFETKEEAEKAVDKLKAWKRLKDKGFRFTGKNYDSADGVHIVDCKWDKDISVNDYVLLFGGEE